MIRHDIILNNFKYILLLLVFHQKFVG